MAGPPNDDLLRKVYSRRQKTEGRRQKTGGRRQEAEGRGDRSVIRHLSFVVICQIVISAPEVRSGVSTFLDRESLWLSPDFLHPLENGGSSQPAKRAFSVQPPAQRSAAGGYLGFCAASPQGGRQPKILSQKINPAG